MNRFSWLIILLGVLFLNAQNKDINDPNFSPYTVVNNFNENLNDDNYFPKKAALSFKKSDTLDREKIAIQLRKILNGRGIVIDAKKIPNRNDYVDSTTHQNIFQIIPSEKRIYVEKYGENWYFSDETVQSIPEMYDEVYRVQLKRPNYFKGKFWSYEIFGISMLKWLGLMAMLLASILGYRIISTIFIFFLRRYAKRKLEYTDSIDKYIRKMARVFALFIVCQLFIRYLPSLQLPLSWNAILIKVVGISSIIFLVLFINRSIQAISYLIVQSNRFSDRSNEQLIPITTRVLEILVWTLGIFYILYFYLNVDPTALIAGLSIGGLALALAAQDTVKNFIGSAIILIDKPFEVNDWVVFNGYEGIVEEVGIRSTRIRSFEDSVIYVPNSMISSDILNNKGLRKFRRFRTTLGIEYDTPPDTIDAYVDRLIEVIKKHPDTVKYNYTVCLDGLGESSINILFNCFFSVPDSAAEFKARHMLLSEIIKLSREMNVEFAYPSRSIYIEQGNNFGLSEKS